MIDFKDAGIKPLSGLEIELRNMTGVDWSNYVQHVVKADELFTQYGCEPTEAWIECMNTMTPNFRNSEKWVSEQMRSIC